MAIGLALLTGVGPAGCTGPSAEGAAREAGADDDAAAAAIGAIALGVDVLLRDSVHLVRGRRVGLITNHTGVSSSADPEGERVSTIDRLHRSAELQLVALYSPEHGIRGQAAEGERIDSGRDAATGLPIHSLYSADRKPTPEMLRGVDMLVFDIQDIGARYYTYVWTMTLAMEAAGEAGIPFLVLDRPNPIGGRLVQGNVLDTAYATFVGLHPVPMRHGLTAGEMARVARGELGVAVDLTVIPMDGWRRSDWYDDTGLAWLAPSPNMPSLASATHYPGTCLFEGTNLSVGRGTDAAFQHVGAPWLDAAAISARLNDLGLPGVRFEAVTFTPRAPSDGKFGDEEVQGIRFVATDRDRYDPTRAAIAVLVEVQRAHPERLAWHVSHFDRLAGTDRVRESVIAGASLDEIVGSWDEQVRQFERTRAPYLLYE